MALRTDSIQAAPEEEQNGELRLDAEGKGYWFSFKNKAKKPEVKAKAKPEFKAPIRDDIKIVKK